MLLQCDGCDVQYLDRVKIVCMTKNELKNKVENRESIGGVASAAHKLCIFVDTGFADLPVRFVVMQLFFLQLTQRSRVQAKAGKEATQNRKYNGAHYAQQLETALLGGRASESLHMHETEKQVKTERSRKERKRGWRNARINSQNENRIAIIFSRRLVALVASAQNSY